MRVVLDTNVAVAAMISPRGSSAALVRASRAGVVRLVGTVAVAIEYEAVLLRPKILERAGLARPQGELFLDGLIGLLEPVPGPFPRRRALRDPNDAFVLEAAVAGAAAAIATFNLKDFRGAPALLGVAVLRPHAILERLGR